MEALENKASLLVKRLLLEGTRDHLRALVALNPREAEWQRNLAASQEKLGGVLIQQGDLVAAIAAFKDSWPSLGIICVLP